ncbi:MAG: hypothetical protein JO197_23915 [Acidobacteria bacterium]|nr:hypothetical protein [Acidobacteriota bacterium]MBV9476923.1 hypothetical protein [Acidobacteriota bacterium]
MQAASRGILIVSSIFASLVSFAAPSTYVATRAAAVKQATLVLAELEPIARENPSHYPDKSTQQKIGQLMAGLKDLHALSVFAKLAAAVQSGLAEHQSYDSVFEHAEWLAIERVASIPGEEARFELENVLKPTLGADGHPAELFSELLAKQRALKPR